MPMRERDTETDVVPVAVTAAPVVAEAVVSPRAEQSPPPVPLPPIAAMPAAPPPPPPAPLDLDAALRDSGLVMIQTKADRVSQPAETEEPSAPRPRRERRPAPADLNAPLMQVETRKGEGETAPPQ